MLITDFTIFIASVIVLAKASHTVIKSSVKIARITRLKEIVVGFLILSIATVLPELTISTTSIMSGNFGIAIGNLLGSNITCLLLIVGLMSITKSVKVAEKTLTRLTEMLFLSSLILIVLVILNHLSKAVGIALLLIFIVFGIYSVKRKIILGNVRLVEPLKMIPKLKISVNLLKSILFFIIGMIVVFASAWVAVNSASNIASDLNIDQSFIGATIMAIGASLPELSTAMRAQKEGHLRLGLGNTIGSCLTRLTLVLGLVLLIAPLSVNIRLFTVLVIFVLSSTLLVLIFLLNFGRRKLDRVEGIILLMFYFLFLLITSAISI